ncbi:hypothetical protein MKW98_001831 [Papaver atlanticum]|uniref:Uncharacterized protein n=1 Tax=Papaver atlanticum TaxID=357466 RepID=A0AAD4SAQ5_9MAGN|nr:hypothetical protein MKW98_001831 [Papaver atlanticum]
MLARWSISQLQQRQPQPQPKQPPAASELKKNANKFECEQGSLLRGSKAVNRRVVRLSIALDLCKRRACYQSINGTKAWFVSHNCGYVTIAHLSRHGVCGYGRVSGNKGKLHLDSTFSNYGIVE